MNSNLRAVDFFCGAGGMTNGFIKSGIEVIAGIDFDIECRKTYESNNKNAQFIHADIKKLSFANFEKCLNIKKNDSNLIFIGCSPCQYWSKIKTDKKKSAESKNLIIDFQKFVGYYKPGFVVIENVPGILTKTKESPLSDFLIFLQEEGYRYDMGIINACEYGVPQTRKRFLLIASRNKNHEFLPLPKTKILPTVRDFISIEKGFPKIAAGTTDNSSFMHSSAGLSEKNLLRIKMTPKNGGTRMTYVNDKALAIKSQYQKSNFSDTYSRMFWDKPAPTITTRFNSISNGRFAHPDQDRAISIREGATLQTFSKSYIFYGKNTNSIAKQIGNAVPPILSEKIADVILRSCQQR